MKQRGFTLIELAIVLIIIGIILGAVFKGGQVLKNAKTVQAQGKIDSLISHLINHNGRLIGFNGFTNPLEINGTQAYVYDATAPDGNQVLLICANPDCTANITDDLVRLAIRLERETFGETPDDAGNGYVRGATAVTFNTNPAAPYPIQNNYTLGTLTFEGAGNQYNTANDVAIVVLWEAYERDADI